MATDDHTIGTAPAQPPRVFRLGRHPRRTDHPALLNADGTPAHTFAYDASREHVAASIAHAGLVLHEDDTVTDGPEPAKEGGEIAASAAAARLLPSTIKATRLGMHLADAERAYAAFDPVGVKKGAGGDIDDNGDALEILGCRIEALRDLISTTPAQSLADAAVLVAEALTTASRLFVSHHSAKAAETMAGRIERMLLSAMPFIAAAAGLDVEDMGWTDHDRMRLVRYAGVGVQA